MHAQAEREGIVRTFLLRAEYLEVCLVALGRLLRETTKKGRQLFEKKNCTPRQKHGYAYGRNKTIFRNSN